MPGRIWLGMRTRNRYEAGTDNSISLVVNQNGQDVVNVTFPDTPQADQERGQANLYAHPLGAGILDPDQLGPTSIRVGIGGHDLWLPEHVVVWYEPQAGPIVPLAMETDMQERLSTDSDEGVSSTPIRRVASGKPDVIIERLLMLMTSGPAGAITPQAGTFLDLRSFGTDSPLQLQIAGQGGLILQYDIPNTPQRDQEIDEANLYLFPAPVPFTRDTLAANAISLSIKGTNAWLPGAFFLFGLSPRRGRPTHLVPLVHLPRWELGWLSTDPEEGRESLALPLIWTP
jgi:hypothetical protein